MDASEKPSPTTIAQSAIENPIDGNNIGIGGCDDSVLESTTDPSLHLKTSTSGGGDSPPEPERFVSTTSVFECDRCSFSDPKASNVYLHLRRTHETEGIICSLCGYRAGTNAILDREAIL